MKTVTLDMGWNFDNSYARLPHTFYTQIHPTPSLSPSLIVLNVPLALSLGLDEKVLHGTEGLAVLAGNEIPVGGLPLAQAYAGHQFGIFKMLGDGRAHLLGEQITPLGERFDIQLKGSGITPYSRHLDGRAALGPMLREYIISEAMFALGIPTTRSLAVVTTGESIQRDTELTGAILTRVAVSHLRIATFQYAAHFGSHTDLRTLADYTLARHFPEIGEQENRYLRLLQEVFKRQALLIAKWQLVGFTHGVMSTDNVSISGITMDYGPCAFLDVYDPSALFSTRDTEGRYAFGKQPEIARWNLARLAEAFLPLFDVSEAQGAHLVEAALSDFSALYQRTWLSGMRAKLGIYNEELEDDALVKGLLDLMEKHRADYTNTFRALSLDQPVDTGLSDIPEFTQWHELWQARLGRQKPSRSAAHQLMRSSNPAVIPRNHRVEEALAAAMHGDYSVMERLLDALANPYAYRPEQVEYATLPTVCSVPYRTFCGT
ncbi:hypothetical protein A8709_15475 [Paenibacillus pectinilyticus]|uniref:Protein nucleotidyltransferase YdiU n=1 Tax=Paenibacillus pectinilyticus TaxID=512399 RepID=A0A1C1A4J8_9BACL|nr:YdiU family protein [Paenibacillus pectinilyticus]OCT15475.1 hypothetical protein A8709_15475 [Paenibacillus pectinilyticus]